MTPEDKLHRAMTKIIYSHFEDVMHLFKDEEDVLIKAVNQCVDKAKEYHKERIRLYGPGM